MKLLGQRRDSAIIFNNFFAHRASVMTHRAGESNDGALRVDFDRRLMLQFRGSVVTSDAGLIAYRELDDALGLSAMAGEVLADVRTGKNGRHAYRFVAAIRVRTTCGI